jgi:dihydroorotase-like cyclic amidohydrolase
VLDLIIRGGEVVTPQGVTKCDVAIKGETIAAVAAPGTLADTAATRIIDVSGKIVMPGGIDMHWLVWAALTGALILAACAIWLALRP